jgi:hypothetical protein
MSQDPVDGVLLLDASDDFDRPTAATANLNVDIEDALESLVLLRKAGKKRSHIMN